MIKLFREKDEDSKEYYISRIEYPDGTEIVYNYEEDFIELSKLEEYIGERVSIIDKDNVSFFAILGDYSEDENGESVIEMEIDRNESDIDSLY